MTEKKPHNPKPARPRLSTRRPPGRPARTVDDSCLKAAIDLAADAVCVKDAALRYIFVNPAAVKCLGVPLKKLIGRTDAQVFGRAHSRETEALDRKAIQTGKTVLGEVQLGKRVLLTTRTPCLAADGSLSGLACVMCDKTDDTARQSETDSENAHRLGLEFLAQTSKELVKVKPGHDLYAFIADRLGELMNGAVIGVIAYDPEKNQYRPRAFAGLKGIYAQVEKLLGRNPLNIIYGEPPDDLKQQMLTARLAQMSCGLHDLFFRTVPKAVSRVIEKQFKVTACHAMGLVSNDRLLGGVAIVLHNGQCLADPAIIETFVNQAAVALERLLDEDHLHRSIAEREQAAEALRASEEFNRAVIEHSPLGISVRNARGELLTCNAAWKQVWGLSDKTMIRDIICRQPELVREKDDTFLAGWRPAVQRVYHDGGALYIPELLIPGSGGAPGRWVALHFNALKNSGGEVERVIVITEDITARRENEDRLRHSEQYFRALIERSSDVITILDPNGVIRYKSQSVTRELGYEPAELIGRTVFDYVHPDDAPALLQSFDRILQVPGAEDTVEFRFRHRDGRWVLLSAAGKNLLREPAVGGIVINSRNIDERKQAADALRESEQRYRALSEASPDMIFMIGTDGRILYANHQAAMLVNMQPEKLAGRNIREFLATHINPRQWEQLQQTLAAGQDACFEEWTELGGRELWLETRLLPLKGDSGNLYAIMGICRDRTGYKLAEDRLHASEERYRALAETSPDMIFTVDHGGIVRFINRTAARYIGREPAEVAGRQLQDFFPPEIYEQQWRNLQAVLSSGQPLYVQEQSIFQGHTFWLDTWLVPLMNARGSIDAVMGISRDITTRRTAEIALQESEQRYRLLYDSINDSVFVHEMRPEAPGRFLEVNDRACERLGYTREEMLGMTVADIDTPEQIAKMPEICRKLFAAGQVLFETDHVAKDGHLIPMELNVRLIKYQGRDAALAVMRDVTERKRAEQALQESESTYRTLAGNLPGIVYRSYLREKGTIQFFNDAITRITGFTPEELTFGEVCCFDPKIHPDDRQVIIDIVSQAVKTGKQFEVTYRFLHKDGSIRSLYERGMPVIDEKGKPQYIDGVIFDVTEHRQAEEGLRREQARLRFILDKIPCGVILMERDGTYLYLNPAFTAVTGYTLADVPNGKAWMNLAFPDPACRAAAHATWKRDRNMRKSKTVCLGVTCQGGQVKEIEFSNVFLDDGRAITTLMDVTKRKLAEVQEQMARKVLELLNRQGGVESFIRDILLEVKTFTGIEAVGIRLKEGDDYPYYQINGFTKDFVNTERRLCARDQNGQIILDGNGHPVLECMCGNIISGRVDPGKPFFTAGGSFWTNSTTRLLDSTTATGRESRTRNRCNKEGYESVALIPLRSGSVIIGLLQLNDKRPGRFTPEMIRFFEGLGASIGVALNRQRAEQALRESEERFRELADTLPETVFEIGPDRKFTYINQTGFKKYGYSSEDFAAGIYADQVLVPEERAEAIARIHARLQGGPPTRTEYTALRKDGTRFPVQIYTQPLLAGGAIAGLRGIAIDVTQIRQAELQYRATLDAMRDNIHLVDRELKILFINKSLLELNRSLGLDNDAAGKDLFALYPFLGDDVRAQYRRVFDTGEVLFTQELSTIAGKGFATEISKIPVVENGQVSRVVTVIRDITERAKSEERIRFLTFHDRLTGLFNRAYFEERIREFDKPEYVPLSLVMGDANGLKLVNDAFGHEAGDKFLLRLAGIIKACTRPDNLIFRWGGDEFVILMPGADNEAALAVCDAIQKACSGAPDDPIQPSIALGAGTRTGPGQPVSQIMMEAEDRMYRHKLVESKSLRSSIISSLGRTLWEADYETEEHALRLQALAREFGRSLKLSDSEMNDLMMLAALHDIGKIAIADGILLKPSTLSEAEWEIVRKHPEIGFRIAQASPELAPIADGILHHHERWDGSGYPQGLKGERTPVIARILAIIDAYDVMTEKRLYKDIVSKEAAIAELERCAGTQFDPALVDLFIKIISRKSSDGQ